MARELLPSVIDLHFKKDIALINGLALLGSSIGGLLLPLLFDVTYDKYGLPGTFLVMGGVLLHCVPAGMLLWSPKSTENKTDKQCTENISEVGTLSCSKQVQIGTIDEDKIPIHRTHILPLPNNENVSFTNEACVETIYKDECSKKLEIIFLSKDDDPKLKNETKDNFNKCYDPKQLEITSISKDGDIKLFNDNIDNIIQSRENHTNITPKPLSETSSENQTIEKRNQEVILRIHNLPITSKNTIETKIGDEKIKPTKDDSMCLKNNKKNAFFEIIGLCWDPLFILVTTSQSLFKTVYITFTLIFMDFARDVDIPRHQAIYLVMCISASDIVGRVGLGWVTDRGYMAIEKFAALAFVVKAAALAVISFWSEFGVMFTAIFVFGLATSALSITTPGIVSKYFEGNRKTTAMASRYFLCGPMHLTISPLIGKNIFHMVTLSVVG